MILFINLLSFATLMCNKQNLCIVVENLSLFNEGYTIVNPKQ